MLVGKHGDMQAHSDTSVATEHEDQLVLVSEGQVAEAIAHVKKAIMVMEGNVHAEKFEMDTQNPHDTFRDTIKRRHGQYVGECNGRCRCVHSTDDCSIGEEDGFETRMWIRFVSTNDADGRTWDSNSIAMCNGAIRRLLAQTPLVLVGGPMCGPAVAMQIINFSRTGPAEAVHTMEHGRRHF